MAITKTTESVTIADGRTFERVVLAWDGGEAYATADTGHVYWSDAWEGGLRPLIEAGLVEIRWSRPKHGVAGFYLTNACDCAAFPAMHDSAGVCTNWERHGAQPCAHGAA